MKHFFVFILLLLNTLIGYSQSSNAIIYTTYFKRGKYILDEKNELALKKLVLKIKADTSARIRIFGFSDTNGSSGYNDRLSKKRVYSVYNYLKTKMDASKILYWTWIGESDDTYDLHLSNPHTQENCVDIEVQFYGEKRVKKPR